MQSTNITEVEFQLHTKVWANAMDTLLSTAIQLYKEKPTLRQFILDDLSIATLDIMPEKLHNADMGIFVADSTKENEVFSNLKSLSTFLANSDKARFSDLIKLFKATSVQELEQQVEETERTMQEEAAQAAQQQQAQFEAQLQADQARIEDEQAHEKELALIDRETKITLKEIDSFKFQQDQDINNNRVPDQLEIEKLRVQASLKKEELQLKREEMESKERIENKKVSSKAPSK